MKRAHRILGFVVAGAIAGCGSSGGANGGDGGGAGGTGGGNMCAPTGTGTGTCTQAELNTYSTCIQNACNTQYVACFGPNYKTGVAGGTCASYAQCQNACGCTDTACRSACAVGSECMTCLSTIGTCQLSANCTLPACALGGIDGGIPGLDGGFPFDAGNATCADLTGCCNAITMADIKMACQQVVTTGNNQICSASLGTFRANGYCP